MCIPPNTFIYLQSKKQFMSFLSTKLIAHRGASFEAPENTLPAIKRAWESGILNVEIDVHLTKDGEIAVIHDANTFRLSGINYEVKNETMAVLKTVDVGIWKGEQWKNTRIPELSEVLETIPTNGTLVIEVKCGVEIIPALVEKLKNYSATKICLICFNYEVILALKNTFPHYKCLWLLDLDYTPKTALETLPVAQIIEKTRKAKLEGVNVWAGKIADENFVKTLKNEGLEVVVWTVNSASEIKHFTAIGVDKITSDHIDWE